MAGQMRRRLCLLDAIRGFLVVEMVIYHGLWDLVYLFGVDIPWYADLPGYLWQQSICWAFLLLSGFCHPFSRHPLRRGLTVFSGGAAVTAATAIFMPEASVFFGVLTCIGSAMVLMIPVKKLTDRLPAGVMTAMFFGLFLISRNVAEGNLGFEGLVFAALPENLYRNLLTAYLGFPPRGFRSSDYFPLIPWFFLYGTGYGLNRLLTRRGLTEKLFARGSVPVLNWVGRHALILYLLHQPVLYGLCILADNLIK